MNSPNIADDSFITFNKFKISPVFDKCVLLMVLLIMVATLNFCFSYY